MKCPNCSREINDSATFCGYCGTHISSAPAAAPAAPPVQTPPAPPEPPVPSAPQPVVPQPVAPAPQPPVQPVIPAEPTVIPQDQISANTQNPKKKSKVGVILLIVFACLAILLGSIGGFLTARGVINLKEIFDFKRFSWLDNGYTTEAEDEEEEDDKKESSDTDGEYDETEADANTDTEANGGETAEE